MTDASRGPFIIGVDWGRNAGCGVQYTFLSREQHESELKKLREDLESEYKRKLDEHDAKMSACVHARPPKMIHVEMHKQLMDQLREEHTKEMQKIREQRDALFGENDALARKIEFAKGKEMSFLGTCSDLRRRLEAQRVTIENYQKEVAGIGVQMDVQAKVIRERDAEIQRLKCENRSFKAMNAEQFTSNSRLIEKVMVAKDEYDKLSQNASREIDRLNKSLEYLREELRKSKEANDYGDKCYRQWHSECHRLKGIIEQVQSAVKQADSVK